eukprot:3366604-Rhodomonas_salina.1
MSSVEIGCTAIQAMRCPVLREGARLYQVGAARVYGEGEALCWSASLSSYAPATPCPGDRRRLVPISLACSAISGPDLAAGPAISRQTPQSRAGMRQRGRRFGSAIGLRARYAMSGTDRVYGALRRTNR